MSVTYHTLPSLNNFDLKFCFAIPAVVVFQTSCPPFFSSSDFKIKGPQFEYFKDWGFLAPDLLANDPTW